MKVKYLLLEMSIIARAASNAKWKFIDLYILGFLNIYKSRTPNT
jgi:hypothetical protein